MTRQPKVTIWRSGAFTGLRWHWHWKAANGLLVGREAQQNGYRDKRDAVKGLEEVTGGRVTITYGKRTKYQQGYLTQCVQGDNGRVNAVRTFVEVLG